MPAAALLRAAPAEAAASAAAAAAFARRRRRRRRCSSDEQREDRRDFDSSSSTSFLFFGVGEGEGEKKERKGPLAETCSGDASHPRHDLWLSKRRSFHVKKEENTSLRFRFGFIHLFQGEGRDKVTVFFLLLFLSLLSKRSRFKPVKKKSCKNSELRRPGSQHLRSRIERPQQVAQLHERARTDPVRDRGAK